MCGICGKISLDGKPSSRNIKDMCNAIAHRGPDDCGVEVFDSVGFGHQRLAIIDLSPKGHQPMAYAGTRFWITFNGEIYNYSELRRRLQVKGYRFKSTSDTEVILALYQEYGVKCLQYLNGMFAFAIYDTQKQLLFAARDRLGEKPFKYYFDGRNFLFASELKAILTQPHLDLSLDFDAIKQYLYWGFVPSPKTGFLHIKKLPASHYLLFQQGKLKVKRYWDFTNTINYDRSEDETIKTLRELVIEGVRSRMVADVPVASFLSGGIDSCIVTGIMSQLAKKPIHTYTIGIRGWKDNESKLAEISSQFHHTLHRTLHVKPNIKRIVPVLAKAYEEPFGDGSAIPSYYVSQAAAKHVKVALNGDGGDENFCGYSNYTTLLQQQNLSALSPLFQLAFSLLSPFKPQLWNNHLYQRLLRVSDILKDETILGYARHSRSYLNLIPWEELFTGEAPKPLAELSKYLPQDKSDLISSVTWADLHNVLPDGLMPKMDIASMQHALETRAPLLDHRLIEFTASVPTHMKYRDGQTKWIFRRAFQELIPPAVMQAPKRGFIVPINQWLKRELKPLLLSTLADPMCDVYEVVNYQTIQRMIAMHQQSDLDYSTMLWRILMLQLWLEK